MMHRSFTEINGQFFKHKSFKDMVKLKQAASLEGSEGRAALGDTIHRGGWRLGVLVSVVGRINEVNQHRARLVHDG